MTQVIDPGPPPQPNPSPIEQGSGTSEFKLALGALGTFGGAVVLFLGDFGIHIPDNVRTDGTAVALTGIGLVSAVYTLARTWRKNSGGNP